MDWRKLLKSSVFLEENEDSLHHWVEETHEEIRLTPKCGAGSGDALLWARIISSAAGKVVKFTFNDRSQGVSCPRRMGHAREMLQILIDREQYRVDHHKRMLESAAIAQEELRVLGELLVEVP